MCPILGQFPATAGTCVGDRKMRKALILAALVGAGLLGGSLYSKTAAAPPTPLDIVFPEYEPQKVVYHVTAGAGWLGSEHRQRLRVLSNHVAALPKGAADLRVVLQGEGVDLLIAARKNESLAAEIDRLKTSGVRFLVCANTVVMRKLDIANLHGADRADFVKAGVAESARLQAAGYVYLKI